MSDELKNDGDLRKLYAENQRRKEKNRSLTEEVNRLKAELSIREQAIERMTKDLETHKQEPSEIQAKYDALQAQVRERDFKDVFGKLASGARVRPEAVEDLWKLSGIQVEGDAPDANKITEAILASVKDRPWLLQPEEKPVEKPLEKGPGFSRGLSEGNGPVSIHSGAMTDVEASQIEWAKFQAARRNGQSVRIS